MSVLKVCRICLRTEAKCYKFDSFQLKYFYEEVLALKVNDSDGLPQWFCFECAAMLHKFHKFKEKCYTGQKVLKEMLWKGPITYEAIYKIDRSTKHLQSMLQTVTVNDKVKTLTLIDSKSDRNVNIKDSLPKELQELQCSTEDSISNATIMADDDSVHTLKAENGKCFNQDIASNDIQNGEHIISETCTNSVKVENNKIIKIEIKDTGKDEQISLKEIYSKCLSENNWKKVDLTEDEALKEFRAKAEDPKYLDAAYKCGDCFKGFSKKNMLNRHVQTRHSEELGRYECRYCRMRFKWNCHLQKHIQQHFTKYECLRCHIVFNLDTSALLHEEYHSGTIKKCVHCNEEFRHMTTYYTHLRTHRSAHVCSLCGASFVSPVGLHQHKQRKHRHTLLESQDSSEDEARSTYCEKCDIRFESRRAFDEHLFHSAMHTQVIKKEVQDDITPTKKILGKRLRAKITNDLQKRKVDLDTAVPPKSKRRRKVRRKRRKPSTCHQCGKHFETQAACMKHHLAAHPRTSFYASTQRHICELCGASLAPGSVAVHQNMHTWEKVHTCDTCGRAFHSAVGLKRHLVTHTGEKPFGCTLCDKRFTQSNSMKLHYRTFHLKQPYPKRSRKKKKQQPNQSAEPEDWYEEESDSQPEPEEQPEQPPQPEVQTDHVMAASRVDNEMQQEDVHYLTLS